MPDNDLIVHDILDDTVIQNETPPDIEDFLAEAGVAEKVYTCSVQQWPVEGGGQTHQLPEIYKSKFPTIAELGTRYGPGKYTYNFKWRVPDPQSGKYKITRKDLTITLSSEWNDQHEEYMYSQKLERKKRLERMRDSAEADNILYGKDNKPTPEPVNVVDDLLKTKNVLSSLGVPFGSNLPAKGDDNMMQFMMTAQQRSSEMMIAMMQSNQNNMMQLVTAIMTNQKPQTMDGQMNDLLKTVSGIVDIKAALNPEKEGMVDKIFGLLMSVSQQIPAMIRKSPAERDQDSLIQMARTSKEFKTVKEDDAMRDALAAKLDGHYDVQTTNNIMGVMGLDRTDAMKAQLKQAGQPTEPEQVEQPESVQGDFEPVEPEAGEPDIDDIE